ncbi:MAG: bifunctional hydroxymethylpyrimidine kinase/phosphomethylpyrimidine kinase [Myxococcales bacterium]|nr:MAG: bifunctional hydroxymethylpyrimidine kinase/phosphomethylpyrimidine kinase [Myxococcales bacterium]
MKFLAVGLLTHDVQRDKSLLPEGPAFFASMAASYLGLRTTLISSVGNDYLSHALLKRQGINARLKTSSATTTFENHYFDGLRDQYVRATAEAPELDLPAADIVFVGPVMNEFSPQHIAQSLPKDRKVAVAGLQGWLRQADRDGKIYPKNMTEVACLGEFNAVVVSETDFPMDPVAAIKPICEHVPIVVLTHGAKGSTLYEHGRSKHIAAHPAVEHDPTGAGDVYAAALACALAQGKTATQSANEASQLAARCVTQKGASALSKAVD